MSNELVPQAMSRRQQLFVTEYLVDLCGTRAAVRAGYAKLSAHVTASRLLDRADIQQAIRNEFAEHFSITKMTIAEELAAIAFHDVSDYMSWSNGRLTVYPSSELSERQRRAIAGVRQTKGRLGATIELRFIDKLKALELLARILGLFDNEDGKRPPVGNVQFIIETPHAVTAP
jgi:phage terminase small subunit